MRVLLTAVGCPNSANVIPELQARGHYIHGVDTNPECIGRFISDKFTKVSSGDSKHFIKELETIVIEDNIDVVFTQSSSDVVNLSKNKDKLNCKVMVSEFEPLSIAINKIYTHETLAGCGITPPFFVATNNDSFEEGAKRLGYMDGKTVICRLPSSKGSRGMFFLSKNYAPDITKKDAIVHLDIDGGKKYMSGNKYIMTEYVAGEEIDSMVLCINGDVLLTTHKTRETVRSGVIFSGELVKRPELDIKIVEILKKIPLSYNISLQFKGGKLIEINPRSSTYIFNDDFYEPELSIGLALGYYDKIWVRKQQDNVPVGTRMIRYIKQYVIP